MARDRNLGFAEIIRERRLRLDLTQEEVARRIKTSTPYIGHLESCKRHPSERVVARLADALGLDRRELFLLANPGARALLHPNAGHTPGSTWERFRKNEAFRRMHNITSEEMEMLGRVALMGKVRSSRDFIYILNTVRQALVR